MLAAGWRSPVDGGHAADNGGTIDTWEYHQVTSKYMDMKTNALAGLVQCDIEAILRPLKTFAIFHSRLIFEKLCGRVCTYS